MQEPVLAATRSVPWWRDHLPLLVGVGIPTLVAVRLMGVAKGNAQTAFAILRELGTGSVVVALVLQALLLGLPLVIGLGGLMAWLGHTPSAGTDPGQQVNRTARSIAIVVVTLVYTVSTSWIATLLSAALLVGLCALALPMWWSEREPFTLQLPKGAVLRFVLIGLGTLALVCALTVATQSPIWLPYESITTAGERPATVFVLTETDDELVVMSASSRLVRRIDASTVEQRHICQPRLNLSTLTNLLQDREQYPRCR